MATPEATLLGGEHQTIPYTLTANAVSGELIKLSDDRMAVVTGLDANALQSGMTTQVVVGGPVRVYKASATDLSSAKNPYWDVTANAAIAVGSAEAGDVLLGTRIGGGATGQTFVDIDLNAAVGTVDAG